MKKKTKNQSSSCMLKLWTLSKCNKACHWLPGWRDESDVRQEHPVKQKNLGRQVCLKKCPDIQDIIKLLIKHSKLSHPYRSICWFYNYVEDSFRHPINNHCYLLTEVIKIHKGSIVECRIVKHICQHPGEWVAWFLGRCMPAVLQAEASAEQAADRHGEEQQVILIFSVVPLPLQGKTKPDRDGAMLFSLWQDSNVYSDPNFWGQQQEETKANSSRNENLKWTALNIWTKSTGFWWRKVLQSYCSQHKETTAWFQKHVRL